MGPGNAVETLVGLLLLFVVPGYAVTRAVFPEWRMRGENALRRGVEVLTLSFVLSVSLTVLLGYVLLSAFSGGFSAAWSDPLLEATLAAVTLVAGSVAYLRGAFARVPPIPPRWTEEEPGEEGAWEVTVELDRLAREERRLEHDLRRIGADPERTRVLRSSLEGVRAERESLERRREAEIGA